MTEAVLEALPLLNIMSPSTFNKNPGLMLKYKKFHCNPAASNDYCIYYTVLKYASTVIISIGTSVEENHV